MLNSVISFSIRNKLIVGLFIAALIGYGTYETTQLPIDAVPDITDNQVQIITVAPSFGATDIERLVTFPIEQANSNIDGIHEIRSFSRFGLSVVTIVFDDRTDIFLARQQVAERLQRIQSEIPASIGTPEMGPITTGLGEIYQYVVRAKEGYEHRYSPMELRTIQDWMVRRQLLGVDGVAEVSSFGGQLKQYEVSIDPLKLKSLGITIDDVFQALEQNNQNTGGAYIEKGPTVLFIRSEGLIGRQEDIENIFIRTSNQGTPLLLRDVAKVNIGFATRYGAMCYNTEGEVAGAVVMMLKGANSSEVIANVKERVAMIQKNLPEGVVLEPFLDRTKMVNNAMGTVEKNLLEGALIVLFVLILFLGNFRAGFLVASVIPLSMLFAIILMNIFGVAGNLMSLGALDFGLIVDGAVVIVEAALHQFSQSKRLGSAMRLTQGQMDEEVEQASKKMARSVVFGQLIILIVYLPTYALSGIEGKMFIPMAQTVSFALLGAFLLSITYVPMMTSLVMSKNVVHKENFSDRMMKFIERNFQNALAKVLEHQRKVIALVLGLFAAAIVVLMGMGGEFIPALEEGDFAVESRVMAGSNLNTSIEYTQKASKILLERFPEVEKVVTKIGSSEIPTDPMPMEAADMMIILKDKDEWTSAETFPELADTMSRALEEVVGLSTGFQYPVQMRFNELMTGARQDVVCKIFGEDLDSLSAYAERLGRIVNTVDGAADLFIEPIAGLPQVVIQYKRDLIAQYGLSIADVNRIVNTAFAGQSAGKVFEGEKRFDLVVRLEGDLRTHLTDIQDLLIPTLQVGSVPLRMLADVKIVNSPNQIQREDTKRRIVVGFNVRDRDVQSLVNELQTKVEAQVAFSPGYYVTYGGAFENLNAAKARLSIAVPVALLLIFILLYFAFNSIKQGLLIYSAIPLSAMGGIFFLAMRGMPFSISAGVGFIALFGVAVLNGIVLVAEFNRLKSDGWTDARKIVIEGTRMRLRPVLITAFVASLGFFPMALSNGSGAEVQRPLATVVIGGLMIATFLTLFVLPILYLRFERMGTAGVGKLKSTVVSVAIMMLISTAAQAQQISLQSATDTALSNSLRMKSDRLMERYQDIKGTINFDPTDVFGEYGQVNSYYTDNKLGFQQRFNMPSVYSKQKAWNNAQYRELVLSTTLTEREIRRTVADVFYHWLALKESETLWLEANIMMDAFENRTQLRFDAGASNTLELNSAKLQREMALSKLLRVQAEIEITQLEFQLMLNTNTPYEPSTSLGDDGFGMSIDSSLAVNHPMLNIMQARVVTAQAEAAYQKTQLLPSFTMGYTNQSFTGLGPNNVTYAPSNRFHSANITLGIPLLRGGQKSDYEASKVQVEIAKVEVEMQRNQMDRELNAALARWRAQRDLISQYEAKQLPSAGQIRQGADEQLSKGAIDFLQWSMLQSQAMQVRLDYVQAQEQLRRSAAEIQYYTIQK
jgi:cobalt-zinc-cadmium resistance protein CzcA